MAVSLNWAEPSTDSKSKQVHCIGCRRTFLTWGAFDAHGSEGSCAPTEKLAGLGLASAGSGSKWVWMLKE